jgi:hypothetical protein
LAAKYARQLSIVLRQEQLAADPSLAAAAHVFGIAKRPISTAESPVESIIGLPSDTGIEIALDAMPDAPEGQGSAEPTTGPIKRGRGRPKGSRNRPK